MPGGTTQRNEAGDAPSAARKRAAVELIARDGAELRRTARRYSLCEEDAEDACQRALEILLLKAPSERPRELIRWTKTVIKHEALAIRRNRERLLGSPPPGAAADEDPTARIPAQGEGPAARAESREHLARSREALRTLKPAELRALTLLAAGYSYAEISEITGFSNTKVNRCLAEGRERFRAFLAGSEDGSRCAAMAPLLSAFCDGEASAEEVTTVREHLRACVACRAALRAYRSTPDAVAALAPLLPALPAARPLLERAREAFHDLVARLPGAGGGADAGVVVAGGTSGAGAAGAAKLLAVCAGTAGTAACVAAGVAPAPLDLAPQQQREARVERVAERLLPAPPAEPAEPTPPRPEPVPQAQREGAVAADPAPGTGAVEYEPAPAPSAEPEPAPAPPPASPPPPSASSGGSAAGEFGP